ncbi:MAG: cytochrome c oxidase subunit 3 [Bernardetiaceae bacterium]|jgi:cytochrome c oxidase subunit 3|nr:cytochrome c oxidase subunit 3 [Bernardetiaceae bacterium]
MAKTKNIAPIVEEQPTTTLAMHPKKFAMWLFIVSILMAFGGLVSAYIVRKGDGNWLEFDLPTIFYWSTGVILLSSATMHWAIASARKDELGQVKLAMLATFGLGLAFLAMQWQGWADLVAQGIYFAGRTSNPAGSFLYVLSGLHGLHLMGGLVFLVLILVAVFQLQVHAKSMVRIEMCATYWHFLDVLWVFLFVFLLVNAN